MNATQAKCREITNADLWASIRGLGMYSMDRDELTALIENHSSNEMFASKVIASAARQVLATKPA